MGQSLDRSSASELRNSVFLHTGWIVSLFIRALQSDSGDGETVFDFQAIDACGASAEVDPDV